MAKAVADELDRPLEVVAFESKYEGDSTLAHEVNALLSSGVCDLASGYPLLAAELGAATRPTARVPGHPGAPPPRRRPWIALGVLKASHPCHTIALGLVVREPARQSATLADLGDAQIGVVAGTMTGTLVTLYRNRKLKSQLVELSRNEDPLEQLEAGRVDATLVPLDRLDAWRTARPSTSLRRTGYLHPLRIHIGFVALETAPAILEAANRVIRRASAEHTLERWSDDTGTTWIAPEAPEVGGPIGLPQLLHE